MMSFVSFFRVIRSAFQNFFRNAWMTVATVSVLTLMLVSVNMVISLNVLGKVALSAVRSKIDVSVHFKPDIDDARVQNVKIFLLSLPEVKDVQYVSPADALQNFSQSYGQDQGIVEALGEVGQNPFGATLVVQAQNLDDYQKIMDSLNDPMYAGLIDSKDFDDRQSMIAQVDAVSKKLELFTLVVSGVFGFIALLIVLNTIRVSIFARKEEIAIMRLVGASDGFIRAPFYVEAVLWSLVAFAICAAVVLTGLHFAQPYLQGFFGTDSVNLVGFYSANALLLAAAEFGGIVLMSCITTTLATARYLKV
jgi:cell division transport system permease protein